MSYSTILFDLQGGIARITLNRPDRLNSFTVDMHAELRDALGKIRDDASVRVLILTGAGRGFCAGQDLNARKFDPNVPLDLGESLERNYNALILALRNLSIPVIAAVNGVAAGSGANLALACDLVVAAKSASFLQAFTKVGLMPDAGGTWFLPHLLGKSRAMGLALLADKLPAEKAAEWGLIWQCVEDDQLAETVDGMAARLAKAPPLALARAKQAILAAPTHTLEQQLALEAVMQRELGRSNDYREGVAAFMEKREPNFKGD